MALDFLPFREGMVLTAANLNELVRAIQDGTIFLNTTYISEQLSLMSSQVSGLVDRVTALESAQSSLAIREQVALTAGQALVTLSQVPVLDTEMLFINGAPLSKSGVPINFVGNYSLSANTVTFSAQLSSQIDAGDMFIVQYRYGV